MNGFNEKVILIGVEGLFKGEEYQLIPGKKYFIGRSSLADISIKNTSAYKSFEKEGTLVPKTIRYVSRRHFSVSVIDNSGFAETSSQLKVPTKGSVKVIIEGISPNGVSIDGKKVSQMIIPELNSTPHSIEFGAGEKLLIVKK